MANRRKLQICTYCGKDLSQIHGGNHMRWCEKNPNNFKVIGKHGWGWNKGETKETNELVAKQSREQKERFKDGTLVCMFKDKTGIPLSQKHKDKLRDIQLRIIKIGKHKGWNHINTDKNRRSYPEKWFIENILEKYDLYTKHIIKEKMPFGKYFFDFAFIDLKLDVEIDGYQHYSTKESIEHDKIRDAYSESNGWKVYRIPWKGFQTNRNIEIEKFLKLVL